VLNQWSVRLRETSCTRYQTTPSLASVWSDAVDRQPILAKYQIALALAKREPFDTGTEPYQSAQALIELRNAIAHPKELTESERQQKNLEKNYTGSTRSMLGDSFTRGSSPIDV
jgi:hypothetical protein